MTKLDILDTLPEIKVCVGYRLNDKVIDYYPSQAADLAKVQPIYETITGWNSSTEGIRSFQELPLNARKYIEMIEKHLNVPGNVKEILLLNFCWKSWVNLLNIFIYYCFV